MEHKTRMVGKAGNCRIEHCTCGAVHVSIGSTTVRVNERGARDLHRALTSLVSQLDPIDPPSDRTVTAPHAQASTTTASHASDSGSSKPKSTVAEPESDVARRISRRPNKTLH